VSRLAARGDQRPRNWLIPVLLAIEFLDEFVFGAREAAWPLIRSDLALSYAQIGLLLSAPSIVSSLIEPVLGILGDTWKRRILVVGGGLVFALSLALTAGSQTYGLLLLSFILFYPASGAFVSLSQATLMDIGPERREHNMARWTFAGSLGVAAGPLALGAVIALGAGWRSLYAVFALIAVVLVGFTLRAPWSSQPSSSASAKSYGTANASPWQVFRDGIAEAFKALRCGEVLRWLTLLEFSDLMLDVLLGFLALYLVDVVGTTAGMAQTAVWIWLTCGLLGDFLLIPLLDKVKGLRYLRLSALIELLLFPILLLIPQIWAKFVLLGLLGLFNAGWYSILKAQLYSAMPGRSGTVMTVGNLFGLLGGLVPLGLGLLAEHLGLGPTMWLLLLGPVALLIGIPRKVQRASDLTG
jgi:FSR family fosmidomycin resistance protein-like MFS transporter